MCNCNQGRIACTCRPTEAQSFRWAMIAMLAIAAGVVAATAASVIL